MSEFQSYSDHPGHKHNITCKLQKLEISDNKTGGPELAISRKESLGANIEGFK